MEYRVADAAERCERQQHPIALRKADAEHREAETGDAGRQDAMSPEAIDEEARQHLREGRNGEENGHHDAEGFEIDPEASFHQGKQRWQHELKEMARAVRAADEADDAGVASGGVESDIGHSGLRKSLPSYSERPIRASSRAHILNAAKAAVSRPGPIR